MASSLVFLARGASGLLPALDLGEAVRAPSAEHARLHAMYAEHGGRIDRFLRDLLGDVALAADGTQETFVRAFKKLPELDAEVRIAPWLFGIARNVSLELRRSRFRANRHLAVVSEETIERSPCMRGSPEKEVLGREALAVVGNALSKLPDERRALLLLRLDHGLAYEDIAETMGMSLAKVKVEIFRAREVLRQSMKDYAEES